VGSEAQKGKESGKVAKLIRQGRSERSHVEGEKNQRYQRILIVTLFVRQVGYCDEFDIFTQLVFSTNSDVLKDFELSAEHAASEPTPAINKAPAPTINKSGHAVINNINLTLFPGGALGNSTTELV
jgi:hypothetical protein